MGRINAVLDEKIDYGFEGGPRYKTGVSDMDNGLQEFDSEWKYARHEFSASFGDIDDPDRDHIISVFHVCRGRRHAIKFKDWNDFEVVDQSLQVLPGTTNPIQLYKTYAPFGPPYITVRPVQAWAWATIHDENEDEVPGTLDLLTGIFIPSAAWGFGEYTLNGEFYVWVRFEADYNPMTINSWRANTASVDLVEDKFKFTPTNVPESWEE